MDIIELAKEAGLNGTWRFVNIDGSNQLEHFAALVRAEVLESAAKVCDERSEKWRSDNDALEARRCAAAIREMK